ERAERDDGTVEVVVATAQAEDRSVRADQLEPADGGRKRPVRDTGTVCRGRDRTADGDVGQRGEVREREAVAVQRGSKLAVADAGLDGDGGIPDPDDPVQAFGGEKRAARVCDPREGVPRTECADLVSTSDELLRLVDRTRRDDPLRRICEVARPVPQWST